MTEETLAGIRRERLVKWARSFACFLIFMWFCTIISRSIYVSKLTRVKSETPSAKYIEHRIENEGIVEAGGEQAVMTISGLRVEKVYVRQGDRVESGELLFEVDLEDLGAIISEKENELAKQQYHLADAQFNKVLSEQKKEVQRLWAQEDYENTQKENAVSISRAEEVLSKANKNLQEHLKTSAPLTSDEDRQKAWESYHNYRNNYYGKQDEVNGLVARVADLERKITELSGQNNSMESQNDNTEPISENGQTEPVETTSNGENTEEQLKSLQTELTSAQEALADAKQKVADYENNPVSKPDYSAEETAYDEWQSKKASLEDAVREAQQKLEDAKTSAADKLRDKLRDTATAETLSQADSTIEIYELELADAQAQLQKYYDIRNAQGKITAPCTGFVLDIQVRAGSRTTDAASVILSDENTPCYFQFSVDKQQSKYIQLGDSVEIRIKNSNSGSNTTEAKVDYLLRNQQDGYDMRCELPAGSSQPGLGGTVVRSVQGEQQKLCIPIEALHQENESYYIFILQEKDGILGKEYYAEKIKVRVLDKNDHFAALEEGNIDKETKVISFSSKELKQGDSVRPS